MQKLEISPTLLKSKVRYEFRKNKFVSDPKIVEILLFKGGVELDECLKGYKQPTHVMRMVEKVELKKLDFLTEFYQG